MGILVETALTELFDGDLGAEPSHFLETRLLVTETKIHLEMKADGNVVHPILLGLGLAHYIDRRPRRYRVDVREDIPSYPRAVKFCVVLVLIAG